MARQTSLLTQFRRIYQKIRFLRYRDWDTVNILALQDFIENAREILVEQDLMPLLVANTDTYIRAAYGFFLVYHPSQTSDRLWGIEHSGSWEHEAVELCNNFMANGGVFLDIGANIGFYSLAVAQKNKNAHVYSFEPIPQNYNLLQRNIEINMMNDQISIQQMGIGEQSGNLLFSINGQLSHVKLPSDLETLPIVDVPVTTLDCFCQDRGIKNIRLIKCDVEGFELSVLRGGMRTLHEQKPVLLFEIEERWTSRYKYHLQDVLQFLQDLGYQYKRLKEIYPHSNGDYLESMFLFVPSVDYWDHIS